MRTVSALSGLIALSSLTAAWPWPPVLERLGAVQRMENLFFPRQHDSGSQNQQPKSASTDITKTPTARSRGTFAPDKTQTGEGGKKTDSSHPTTTSQAPISPVDPAGEVSMISPAVTAGPQYYKIGEWVTFAWNYTYLLRDPKAIDVLVSLSQSNGNGLPANTATFTLTQNMSFVPNPTLLWDTNNWSTSETPLAPGGYKLIIYDADAAGGITAIPKAGYLGAYQQYTFGMYTSAAYTALAPEYQCATCNSAASLERMTLGFLLAMTGLTVVSFTWFACGTGVLF